MSASSPSPDRLHPGHHRRLHLSEAEHHRQSPVQPDEVGDAGLDYGRGGLPRDGHPQGVPRQFPRAQHRLARGFYYRPSTFRSRSVEWEETVHQDTGSPGFTTKAYLLLRTEDEVQGTLRQDRGPRALRRRLRHHEDNQTAKPQAFRTGDGWFSYNLAGNLGQME